MSRYARMFDRLAERDEGAFGAFVNAAGGAAVAMGARSRHG